MPKGKMSSGQRNRCRISPEIGPKGGASDPDFGWFVENSTSPRSDVIQTQMLQPVNQAPVAKSAGTLNRAPVDPNITLADFLVAMKSLAGTTQTAMAEELGQNISNFSFWFRGLRIPSLANMVKIQSVFDLTDDEALALRKNAVLQREYGEPDLTKEAASEFEDHGSRIMAAFITRAETGPPLTEAEVGLVKYILEQEVVTAPHEQ